MKINKKNIKHDSIVLAIILGFIGFIALIIWGKIYHGRITKTIAIIAAVLFFILAGFDLIMNRYIESDSV